VKRFLRTSPLFALLLALQASAQLTGAESAPIERGETAPAARTLEENPTFFPMLPSVGSVLPLTSSLGSVSAAPQPTESRQALETSVLPDAPVSLSAPSGLPASAVPSVTAAPPAPVQPGETGADAETTLAPVRGRPHHLGRRIDEARRLWAVPQDHTSDVAVEAYSPAVAQVSLNIESQLAAMAATPGNENDPLFTVIARNAQGFLRTIDQRIKNGAIDPSVSIRTSASDSAKPVVGRKLRVGIYPVAGDPLHWAHLLVGLQAMARLKLDKVVFVIAGNQPNKPNMTDQDIRYPMDQAVLDAFKPLFDTSEIALGTRYDGETNAFRMLALNPDQKMDATYLVGDDHYKPDNDTISKLEKNRFNPELKFDPNKHEVSVAFIEREATAQTRTHIPTDLDVQFLPRIEFEASSTEVRKHGHYTLMPYSAYDYVRRNKLGLYGIPAY
jgi:hypothetical protein